MSRLAFRAGRAFGAIGGTHLVGPLQFVGRALRRIYVVAWWLILGLMALGVLAPVVSNPRLIVEFFVGIATGLYHIAGVCVLLAFGLFISWVHATTAFWTRHPLMDVLFVLLCFWPAIKSSIAREVLRQQESRQN